MRELGRVNLYRWLLEQLGDGSGPVFQEMRLGHLLRVNLMLLEGIEDNFLTDDWGQAPDLEPDREALADRFGQNLENVRGLLQSRAGRQLIQILLQMQDYGQQRRSPYRESRYFFNQLIRQLSAFNVQVMEHPVMQGEEDGEGGIRHILDLERGNRPQVFCSHAYSDHLYTYGLFQYLYDIYGIYLYLDWMHNPETADGIRLKQMLQNELCHSKQLLFIRSPNSELKIRGQGMIRGWCSWELGNYYGCGLYHGCGREEEKYLLNLYTVSRFGRNRYDDIQLHGMKVVTEIHRGYLEGRKILP